MVLSSVSLILHSFFKFDCMRRIDVWHSFTIFFYNYFVVLHINMVIYFCTKMIDWYGQHVFSDIFTKFSDVFTKMISEKVLPVNIVSGVFFSRQIWISWLFLMLSNKKLSFKRFIFISHDSTQLLNCNCIK